MNELNELIQNEYEAMSGLDTPTSEMVKNALKIVRDKLTTKEYLSAEESLYKGYVEAESFAFEQGFIRGIAVAKGGAV